MLSQLGLHRRASVFVLALVIVLAGSCREKDPPPRRNGDLAPQGMPSGLPKSVRAPSGGGDGVSMPADAQWTICCQAIGGPAHVEMANNLKARLAAAAPIKDWYVIHEEAQSVLYYGFYRSLGASDPKEAERVQRDQRQIQSMVDSSGDRLFPHCYVVQVTTPDPAAPAEWNLANADGFWSLQIAAYKDSPKRKQYAVDAVREARQQGIPAYFYHGDNTSMVFVGAWPRGAVKEQDESTGNAPDPSQPLLVLPEPLPAGAPTELRDREGNRVRTLAPRLEPLDPSMIEAMQKYPNNVVNGMVNVSRVKDPIGGSVQELPDPSFLVAIPRKQPSLLNSAAAPPPEAPVTFEPPPAAVQHGGKLRSITDQ
jgi:hypothetical protein